MCDQFAHIGTAMSGNVRDMDLIEQEDGMSNTEDFEDAPAKGSPLPEPLSLDGERLAEDRRIANMMFPDGIVDSRGQ
jgi:hypothetical protein